MANVPLLLGLALHLLSPPASIVEMDYTVHPVPQADRTRIEVTLTFKAKPDEQVSVNLPRDYFGSPPLPQFVEGFEGLRGTKVEAGKTATERLATPNEEGVVALKYTLSYDPAKLENATFSPNVSPRHFFVQGCQWMLPVGNLDESRLHRIKIVDPPTGWRFFSSLGPSGVEFSSQSSYSALFNSTLGGTSRGFYEVKVRGKPVTVSIPWSLQLPDEKVVDSIQKIVDLQRRWFKDDSDAYFHVAVNPKEDNIAGICVRKHFVCFLKHDVTQNQLNLLLAHEMFHNWMGNQITVFAPNDKSGWKYFWFKEGVNEYYARKLLLEAGLITKDVFVEQFNADLLNLRDNPNRNADLAAMERASEEGRFDVAFTKLSYYRGPLIALEWERKLKAAGKPDSSGFLAELFRLSKHGTEAIPEDKLFSVSSQIGIPMKEDVERYIVQGQPIVPASDALGPEFELVEQSIPAYDLGFDLGASRAAGEIKGVQQAGNAYKAGLRDGMKLVSTANSNRFGNAWDKTKPFRVVVMEDGKQRNIDFFPHGVPQPTLQFVRKK